MGKDSEIKRALIEALGVNPNLPLTATVISVENDTCTIELVTGLKLSDVRLNATISEEPDTFIIVPKIGSEVIVMSQTGKLSGMIVLKMDTVEKIEYKKGDFEFTVDGTTGKLTLKKSGANLGSLIDNLITTISGAIIDTPNGPGAINAVTQTQLNSIKSQFNQLLNSN
jgi:hypothetical protein